MQALSVDAEGYARWRLRAGRATVHSVFERVVNLQGAGGDLFTIAAGLDDGPDTVIAQGPLPVAGVAPGCLVEAGAARIVVGHAITLELGAATAWRAVLPPYPLQTHALRRNLAVVRLALARRWMPGGRPSALGQELAQLLARRRDWLCAALTAGDREAACRHAQAMLGLGPGLTPAGDDFLAGLLAVLHLPDGPAWPLRDIGGLLVADAGRRTNAISVAMLRAAAQGRVRECVIALLRELVAGDPRTVDEALARVLAIGSTSGSDMAAGVLAAFDVQLARAAPAEPARVAA